MHAATLRRPALFASLALALGLGLAGTATADLKDIQQKGALKIGLEGTYPPFNYQDESGKLTGFEVELAQALAKELGVKAEFQPTKWDGILAALESRRLDVAINQVTISEERKKKYDFTTPTPSPASRPWCARARKARSRPPPTWPARRSAWAWAPTTSSG